VNRGESLKSHRDIEAIGNSGSEEILPLGIAIRDIPARSGPSVGRGHVAEIKRHRRLAHREIGISRDKRTGKSQVKTPT
jgi:hypothetical protein